MLEARGVSLRRLGSLLLSGIDLILNPGELTILTGPNGSGKSLLLHILAGLIEPEEGELKLNNSPFPDSSRALGTDVGLVFQNPELQIIEQTVEQDILFGLDNLELSLAERMERLALALEESGLEERRNQAVDSLSGGELRRLALASILAMGPRIILLDEPFENLDFPGVRETLSQLLRLREQGCSLLVVTHGLEKCLAHADRLVLMKSGRIIADALPQRVLPFLEDHDVRRPPMKIRDMSWLVS